MTTARVVEMSVNVGNNPIQDYVHLDDHTPPTILYVKFSFKFLVLWL